MHRRWSKKEKKSWMIGLFLEHRRLVGKGRLQGEVLWLIVREGEREKGSSRWECGMGRIWRKGGWRGWSMATVPL